MNESLKQEVRERAAFRCEYCRLRQEHVPFPSFHVEHIRAKKHGGSSEPDNLCLACGQCNLHKSSNLTGVDPESDEITPLFNPRIQLWEEHFTMIGVRIEGTSPTGRATVRVLNMNDDDRVMVRLQLLKLGELDS